MFPARVITRQANLIQPALSSLYSGQTYSASKLTSALLTWAPILRSSASRFVRLSSNVPVPNLATMSEPDFDKSQFIIPNDQGLCLLECKTAFEGLTPKERHYAYYIGQAAWYGSLICLYQTSPESPGIFILLQRIFREQSIPQLKQTAKEIGLTDEEFKAFLMYAAGFYGNLGNYKSFGDTKIVPNLDRDKFQRLIQSCQAYKSDPSGIEALWEGIKERIFSVIQRERQLGLGDKGITTYFSDNCDMKDAEIAQEFLTEKDISAYNTRLFKTQKNNEIIYEVRLASANEEASSGDNDLRTLGEHEFTSTKYSEKVKFRVTRGDYAPLMKLLAENLKKAQEYAANDDERNMLGEYVRCFTEGSIPAHKEGSRHWIRNKGPIIETYIGFIESYRDPYGVRGEFEGFVAMVNKKMSAKFQSLVENAEHFLPLLPWPSSYEKDTFLRPDFTSLDVLMFGSSGIPAGINIPNYDDIRQSEGFKNVSLGNVLSSGYKETKDKVTFLEEGDKELFTKLKAPSFEVQVGLHELLGHGSGKLFSKNDAGELNFNAENVKHTETGEKISSWYSANETYDSKFPIISSPYEECRAECVGIYLCLSSEILKVFGLTGEEADDIIYINWLNMVRAGLCGLEFYTPESMKWRQAHMQARFVILRVLMEAGEGLVTINKRTGEDGKPDVIVKLDRSKINTVGKKAIGDFLRKLQVYKSTGDYASGKAMFEHYSEVTDNAEPHFLSLRSIVLARKQPRKIFVQCNTSIEGDSVSLKEYEATVEGLIQSYQDRFPSSDIESTLQALIAKDTPYFP